MNQQSREGDVSQKTINALAKKAANPLLLDKVLNPLRKINKALYLIVVFFCACFAPQHVNASGNFAGTVTDSLTGLPVSGALIVATKGNQQRQTTTTAMDGTYSITNLNQANFTIIASQSGYQTQAIGARIINGVTNIVDFALVPDGGTISGTVTDAITTLPIAGASVEIFHGQTLITTATTNGSGAYSAPNLAPGIYNVVAAATGFQMQSQGATVLAGVLTVVDFALSSNPGTISGTVTDANTTNPIAGALVEVFNGSILLGFTDTDVSGNYTILDLAPGSYTVTASADGYQTKTVGASVTAGATTTVDFALEIPPGTIAGTVTDALTGNPIPGAAINVFQGVTLISSVLTDTNGQYTISEFLPGDYLVSANANLYQQQIKAATVASNATTTVNFALIAPPGTISGTVTDAVTTNPIAGATINVYSGQILTATALTDPNGNYQIPNLAPDNYIVTASAATYQTQARGGTVTASATTVVNFALISPPGTISGTVTDAITTNPIEGANVSVFSGQTLIASALTDVSGNYTIPDLEPGQYNVIASAGANYQIASLGATVVGGMTTTVNFALQPNPGAIAGTVTNEANGAPIPGTSILVLQNFTVVSSALTDANGNYSIPDLAPGNYTVIANAQNFSIAVVGATVTVNTTTTVNFALKADLGKIFGTVTDSVTTLPIPGATIQVRNSFIVVATSITDSNGGYNFPNLAPDTYTVTASAPDYQRQAQSASVTSNQVTVVNFALISNPGTISGTVTDAITTNPIPDTTVAVFQGSTLIDSALTDVNGNYTIPDLAPGDYTVLAIAQGYQAAFLAETVTAGATTVANFALNSNPGTIAGIVTDTCTGNPVPGALISVTQGSTIVGFGLTDASGNYSIDTLAPGNYTVTAVHKNSLSESSAATVTANMTTIVNFSLTPAALAPTSISGCSLKNKFLTETDLIHALSWTASPSSCVTGYQIFRNGTQIAFVPSSKLEYQDHNRGNKTDVYSVIAVNSFGQVSSAVSVTINKNSKCPKKSL